ncbi:MAG TPA: hypothetical protein VI076_13710 [Actinopolymorphaceae bacterium]
MTVEPEALEWARWRALGPIDTTPYGEAGRAGQVDLVPKGMRVLGAEGRSWLLGTWPDRATPAMVREYDVEPLPVERPGETRRALAAALRCCWPHLEGSPWPGVPAPLASVTGVFVFLSRGDAELLPRWAIGALRRLHESAWVLLDETRGTVRLGPRVASWPEESLTPLREMLRRLPAPPSSTTDASAGEPT